MKHKVVMFKDEADSSVSVVLNDKLQMPTKRRFKMSGQMIAPCSIARTGIMEYRAKECGDMFKDRDPDSIVKIMTTETELFDEACMDSFRSTPITVGHPEEDVNTENAKELVKGMLEGNPFRDGNMLVGSLVLNDADAIALVRSNINQLSSGHTCVLKLGDGKEWDAEKTMIRANHIAIVSRGRNGNTSIADEESVDETEATVVEEEFEVEPEDKPEDINIEKPTLEVPDEVRTQDKEIEVLKAKVDDLEAKLADALAKVKVNDSLDVDKLVEDRMAFVAEALSLADVDVKGKSEIEIKRAVVSKLKDIDLKDKSDTYVDVRYQILLEDKDETSTDMSRVLRDVSGKIIAKDQKQVPANVSARDKMIKRNEGVK